MIREVLALAFAAILTALTGCAPKPEAETKQLPNIVIILADDLGYSDIGAMGSEIPTPHLDRLADEGRILTAMYSGPMPISRATLISGADHHLVGYGAMGPAAGKQVGAPGYERRLNDKALSIADLLRALGYQTYMAGTWGLDYSREKDPSDWGFDKSFALMEAAADYFPPEPARLSKTESITFRENGEDVEQPDAYLTDALTDKMIGFIRSGAKDRPFFAYLSYTAPHFPLQAPDDLIDAAKGAYDAGYDAARLARINRQKRLGVIDEDFKPAIPVPETTGFKSWSGLSAAEQAIEVRRMEIYAAIIRNLDWNIGRLVESLKASDRYDNTLVIFASGNGAAGAWVTRRRPEDVDNSLANMGHRHSWVTFTERWAEAANAPLSMWKGKMTEGGISTAAIVRLPGEVADGKPAYLRAPATFADIAPTLLDLAQATNPGASFQGRSIAPIEGVSLLPMIKGEVDHAHSGEFVFADELAGEAYVRRGNWKAVLIAEAVPGSALQRAEAAAIAIGDLVTASQIGAQYPRVWKLYNIASDRGETTDLAAAQPDILADLQKLYEDYRKRVGVVDP